MDRGDYLVESDGTSTVTTRDAPGQSCWYIPPGDHRDEYYRLGTYGKFPDEGIPQMADMASAGFYFTGFKDRVKCFSCGITVENWTLEDDGRDPGWHKSTCNMARGSESQNVGLPEPNYRTVIRDLKGLPSISSNPESRGGTSNINRRLLDIREGYPDTIFANIVDADFERRLRTTDLRSEYERRRTFENFPSYPAPNLVGELAKDGFFYLGNLDRTQCFSCSGVLRNWGPNDDVREQHSQHFPRCRLVRSLDGGNIPMDNEQRSLFDSELAERLRHLAENTGEPPDPSPDVQRHLAEYLPCISPCNPHMQTFERRLATFERNWPSSRIDASVQRIARAGLYYLGQGDKTKCFYCNGGLQNWDRNDDPWTEHAKWFPGCEFVLRHKGPDFVRALFEAHPNLNRPAISNAVLYQNIPPFPLGSTPESTRTHESTPNVDIRQFEAMGFTQQQIHRAISNTRLRGVDVSSEELLQYLLEDHGPNWSSNEQNAAQKPTSMHNTRVKTEIESNLDSHLSSENAKDESHVVESIRQMTNRSLCRICKRRMAVIALTPCGHLSMCEDCSADVTRCVVCNSRIQEKLKVYRA